MSKFPLNIGKKEDHIEKLELLKGVDSKYYESANEINDKKEAIEENNNLIKTVKSDALILEGKNLKNTNDIKKNALDIIDNKNSASVHLASPHLESADKSVFGGGDAFFSEKLGIGKIIPTEQLDVNGNARIRNIPNGENDITVTRNIVSKPTGEIAYMPILDDSVASNTKASFLTKTNGIASFSGTTIGSVKIALPKTNGFVVAFSILISSGTDNFSVKIKGYLNLKNEWGGTYACLIGKKEYTIRFGYDGSNPCVYIGELTNSFASLSIAVFNVFISNYNFQPEKWKTGWKITQEKTAFQNISQTHRNTLIGGGTTIPTTEVATAWKIIPVESGVIVKTLKWRKKGNRVQIFGENLILNKSSGNFAFLPTEIQTPERRNIVTASNNLSTTSFISLNRDRLSGIGATFSHHFLFEYEIF